MKDIKIDISGGDTVTTSDELNKLVDPATKMAMTSDLEKLVVKESKLTENKLLTEVTPEKEIDNPL